MDIKMRKLVLRDENIAKEASKDDYIWVIVKTNLN